VAESRQSRQACEIGQWRGCFAGRRNAEQHRLRKPRRHSQHGGFSKTGVGGPETEKFWAEVQNNGTTTKLPTYKDPATNGDAEAIANSNCEKEKFVNKAGEQFPPETTGKLWDEVTTGPKQTNYPICGLTYDMGLTSYKNYGLLEGEALTVNAYLEFVVDRWPKAVSWRSSATTTKNSPAT